MVKKMHRKEATENRFNDSQVEILALTRFLPDQPKMVEVANLQSLFDENLVHMQKKLAMELNFDRLTNFEIFACNGND